MNLLNKYKHIKITCFTLYDNKSKTLEYKTYLNVEESTSKLIEKSNFYIFITKSRIDGKKIYSLKPDIIRRLKIEKITGNKTYHNKFINLIDKIKYDIDIIGSNNII